jgi:type III pantothenate kinase
MRDAEFLLVDVSNSFTKIARASRREVGRIHRIPTPQLTQAGLRRVVGKHPPRHAIVASVVPGKNPTLARVLPGPICWVGPNIALGVGIDYPNPRSIGADRLANAAAAAALYGTPAIVVDFGTAVTFDVVSPSRKYIGGVIAPGLGVMTEYLHRRTALLPLIALRHPPRAVGRSTHSAMLAGAVHGYRGLVQEILRQIRLEQFPRTKVRIVATGGDAELIGSGIRLFDAIDPRLTLEGLRLIGCLNFPESKN